MPTWSELPGWDKFKKNMVDARVAPSAVFPDIVEPPIEPPPHGPFRSHTSLPTLTAEECARMEPVWDAIYGLVRAHPEGCGCDPTVMAWRASYATAEILLRTSDANGPFRRPYAGDVEYIHGWRCWRCSPAIVRHSKAWDMGTARKAYEAHVEIKHPEGVGDE